MAKVQKNMAHWWFHNLLPSLGGTRSGQPNDTTHFLFRFNSNDLLQFSQVPLYSHMAYRGMLEIWIFVGVTGRDQPTACTQLLQVCFVFELCLKSLVPYGLSGVSLMTLASRCVPVRFLPWRHYCVSIPLCSLVLARLLKRRWPSGVSVQDPFGLLQFLRNSHSCWYLEHFRMHCTVHIFSG